jgi:two-component system LytT family sensor kinase
MTKEPLMSVSLISQNQAYPRKMKLFTHILFWLGYLVFVSFVLTNFLEFQGAVIRTLIMGLFHAGLVYIHLLVILPRYYDQQRYLMYGLTTLGALLLFSLLRLALDYQMSQISQLYQDLVLSPTHIATILVTGVVVILITAPLKLIEDRYLKIQLAKDLENQRLEAELKFLKAQVNPHFLFNALNNIYSLAFTESKQTAPTVLKLSEMMRYMLYECKGERVPLKSEITYLQNFIELQQLKTEKEQHITLTVKGDMEGYNIPPLLFVPLLENGFKHGNPENLADGWIKVYVTISDTELLFQMKNTVGEAGPKDDVGGIGLENIRKRLELLFPGAFTFNYQRKDKIFDVSITIPLALLSSKSANPTSPPWGHNQTK